MRAHDACVRACVRVCLYLYLSAFIYVSVLISKQATACIYVYVWWDGFGEIKTETDESMCMGEFVRSSKWGGGGGGGRGEGAYVCVCVCVCV